MGENNRAYDCMHEELIRDHELRLNDLKNELGYKKERLDAMDEKIDKIDNKIDTLTDNVNKLILKSVEGDNDLDKRLKAIETELAVQKEITSQNHNRTSILLAIVGVGLTILTILINVYFNIIH